MTPRRKKDEDAEQQEVEPVEEDEDFDADADADEEGEDAIDEDDAEQLEEQVSGNVQIDVSEDELTITLPRDGREGKRLQSIGKLVSDL